MKKFLFRDAKGSIESTLKDFSCVLLLGPRQVGKTWLAQELEKEAGTAAVYLDVQLDVEQKDNRKIILNNFYAFAQRNAGKLIILDEAQCAPGLFTQLRSLLDNQDRANAPKTRWLLLGSATPLLLSLAASNLGGRYKTINLTPFQLSELGQKKQTTIDTLLIGGEVEATEAQPVVNTKHAMEQLQQLWLRGGFPRSFLARDNQLSLVWRREYLQSIFDPDSFVRDALVKPILLRPLWEHLSINQGRPCNINKLPNHLGFKNDELIQHLSFLVQNKLLRELRPWFENENKRLNRQPRYFIRDSGLLHTQWGFSTYGALMEHDVNGRSWEGFVLEALLAVAPASIQAYFYHNEDQDETDIVLEIDLKRRWVIEIKLSDKPTISKGFYRVSDEIEAERKFVIHHGPENLIIDSQPRLESLCLTRAIEEIRNA
jgi:hypothetical protein